VQRVATFRCRDASDSETRFDRDGSTAQAHAVVVSSALRIDTIGHSTRPLDAFVALLRENAVELLVDVRSIPRSRTNPQYNADTLPDALAPDGIAYRHIKALGGLRGRRRDAAPSPNLYWENAAFRNYADYAMGAEFHAGLDELIDLAETRHCAIMCAEAVWWRCHRRIITDYLLARGIAVRHIMAPGKAEPAKPTPGMQETAAGTLIYPAP
jgi:uncharacterized protein (DUF488 family)